MGNIWLFQCYSKVWIITNCHSVLYSASNVRPNPLWFIIWFLTQAAWYLKKVRNKKVRKKNQVAKVEWHPQESHSLSSLYTVTLSFHLQFWLVGLNISTQRDAWNRYASASFLTCSLSSKMACRKSTENHFEPTICSLSVLLIDWAGKKKEKKRKHVLSEQQAEKLCNKFAELNVSIPALAPSPWENWCFHLLRNVERKCRSSF